MPTGGGGGGGGGLSSVTTDSTLTGLGTAGSHLGQVVATFYTPFVSGGAASGFGNNLNQVYLNGIWLPALSVGHIAINVTTADAVNLYDVGFYNSSGTLIANIGARSLPSTSYQTFAFSQGQLLVPAGLYFMAMTGNATTAKLGYINNGAYVYATATSGGATVGGALAASVTPPTLGVTGNANLYNFVLY